MSYESTFRLSSISSPQTVLWNTEPVKKLRILLCGIPLVAGISLIARNTILGTHDSQLSWPSANPVENLPKIILAGSSVSALGVLFLSTMSRFARAKEPTRPPSVGPSPKSLVSDVSLEGYHKIVSFRDMHNNILALEGVKLIPTVQILKGELASTIHHLKRCLKGDSDSRKSVLQCRLDEARKHQVILNVLEGDHAQDEILWASTNAPKQVFKELGKEGAKKSYLPVLGNLWMQTVRDSKNNLISAIARSAAITDFSHGEISLQELQDYEALLELCRSGPSIIKKLPNFDSQLNAAKNNNNLEANEVISKAYRMASLYGFNTESNENRKNVVLKFLKKMPAFLQDLEYRIFTSYGSDFPEYKCLATEKGNYESKQVAVNRFIADRKNKLMSQVLQELSAQFQTKPVKDAVIYYGRLSLVDMFKEPEKQKNGLFHKEETGLVLHERTQALDIKAIYDLLDGAEVRFDVDDAANPSLGAFVDGEGCIHMPKRFYQGIPKGPVKLSTNFFNISVQGNTWNEGPQRVINKEAFRKLERLYHDHPELMSDPHIFEDSQAKLDYRSKSASLPKLSKFENIRRFFSKKNYPFEDVAYHIVQLLKDHYLAVNCYGGKDRTGYMLAWITFCLLVDMMKESPDLEELKKRFKELLTNEQSILKHVINQNTGHTAVKLSSPDLQLFDKWTKRTLEMVKAAKVYLIHPQPPTSKREADPRASKIYCLVPCALAVASKRTRGV